MLSSLLTLMTFGDALSKQEAVNYLSSFTLFWSAYI